jgi:hypothetical protein
MEKNVGKIDKIIRYVLAAVSAYLGYSVSAWFYIVTVIALVTAATGFCALYPLLGINTCKVKKK